MQRNVSTTVRVKLHSLTNRKANLLAREYEAFQTEVHAGDAHRYSATDQQASKVQRQKDLNRDTEQPLVLRNDVFDVVHDEYTVLPLCWVKAPVYDPERGRGTSGVPLTSHTRTNNSSVRAISGTANWCCRDGDWYVHLVVKRPVTVADEYDDVPAIDMGARWVATCAFLSDRKTTFYGEEVRRIREHYKQLRKSIRKRDAGPSTSSAMTQNFLFPYENLGDMLRKVAGIWSNYSSHPILSWLLFLGIIFVIVGVAFDMLGNAFGGGFMLVYATLSFSLGGLGYVLLYLGKLVRELNYQLAFAR